MFFFHIIIQANAQETLDCSLPSIIANHHQELGKLKDKPNDINITLDLSISPFVMGRVRDLTENKQNIVPRQNYEFVDPEGKSPTIVVDHPGITIKASSDIPEFKSRIELANYLAKEGMEVAKRQGLILDLVPVTKLSKEGEMIPLEGGMHMVFLDRNSGRYYKRLTKIDKHSALSTVRQSVMTEYVNKGFIDCPDRLGIGVEVLQSDERLAAYGWTSQVELKLPSVDEYRKTIKTDEEKQLFEEKLRALSKEINRRQKIAMQVVDNHLGGRHVYRATPDEVQRLREKLKDLPNGEYPHVAANAALEEGLLTDLDFGKYRGKGDDFINCKVDIRKKDDKLIPFLVCFDI